jgi:hypothetical protein
MPLALGPSLSAQLLTTRSVDVDRTDCRNSPRLPIGVCKPELGGQCVGCVSRWRRSFSPFQHLLALGRWKPRRQVLDRVGHPGPASSQVRQVLEKQEKIFAARVVVRQLMAVLVLQHAQNFVGADRVYAGILTIGHGPRASVITSETERAVARRRLVGYVSLE